MITSAGLLCPCRGHSSRSPELGWDLFGDHQYHILQLKTTTMWPLVSTSPGVNVRSFWLCTSCPPPHLICDASPQLPGPSCLRAFARLLLSLPPAFLLGICRLDIRPIQVPTRTAGAPCLPSHCAPGSSAPGWWEPSICPWQGLGSVAEACRAHLVRLCVQAMSVG